MNLTSGQLLLSAIVYYPAVSDEIMGIDNSIGDVIKKIKENKEEYTTVFNQVPIYSDNEQDYRIN